MPVQYQVDEERNFVYVKATGPVTEEDLLEHASKFFKDPRIKAGFRELFDATAGFASGVSECLVEKLLEIESQHPEIVSGRRTALVVPRNPDFDMAKSFEKHAPGNVIVFHNFDVAKTWLGYVGTLGT